MRMTIRISSAGDRWAPLGVPRVDFDRCFVPLSDGRRKADPEACALELIANEGSVYAIESAHKLENCIACQILAELNAWIDAASVKATAENARGLKRSKDRIGHRVETGRCAFVRVDVRGGRGNDVRVTITHDDNGTVMKERYERVFAAKVAAVATCVGNAVAKQGVTVTINPEALALLESVALLGDAKTKTQTPKEGKEN